MKSLDRKDVSEVVDAMFKLFADLNVNSDTVYLALEVSLETMTTQFGYGKGEPDGNH